MTDPAKQRYFQKMFDNAPLVECVCGCGILTKSKDKYGRDKKFINGHNGRKYKDPTQYKREWNHRNRPQRYKYKKELLHRLKADLIEKLGSKCSNNSCGLKYDGTNASVFDLHHTRDKRITLSLGNLNRISKEEAFKEAEKCELLCSNCHRQHHSSKY